MPSSSDWRNASSRLGPWMPFVAGAVEHVAGAALLDVGALAGDQVRLAFGEPAGRQAGGGQHDGGQGDRTSSSCGANPIGHGTRQGVEIPLGGGDAPCGRRRPTTSARGSRRRSPPAWRRGRPSSAPSQPIRQAASSSTASGPTAKDNQARAGSGNALGERLGHLGQTGMAGDDRQRTGRGALGGDHPERLGEDARRHQRLGGGQQVGELVVLEPAGEGDAIESGPARAAKAQPGSSRPSSARGSRRARRAGLAPPGPRASRRSRRSRSRASGCSRSTSGHAASSRSHALGRDQLADEDDQPAVGARCERPRAPPPGRARTSPLPLGRASSASRSASARTPARAASGSRGANCLDVDARRARAASARASSRDRRPQALARVARADEDRRAPARAPRAPTGRKRGCGLTTYSSAEPWIFTAYGTSVAERAGEHGRAHDQVVGQRDVGQRGTARARPRRWRRRSARPPRR